MNDQSSTKFRRVQIIWWDAAHYSGYHDLNDIPKKPVKMRSVGWEIYRNKKVIVLATTLNRLRVGDVLTLPMGCVSRVRALVGDGDA